MVAREEVRDWDGRLELTDDGEMEAEPKLAEPELNLLEPLLKRLELARNPDLELLPKAGVAWGAAFGALRIAPAGLLAPPMAATALVSQPSSPFQISTNSRSSSQSGKATSNAAPPQSPSQR